MRILPGLMSLCFWTTYSEFWTKCFTSGWVRFRSILLRSGSKSEAFYFVGSVFEAFYFVSFWVGIILEIVEMDIFDEDWEMASSFSAYLAMYSSSFSSFSLTGFSCQVFFGGALKPRLLATWDLRLLKIEVVCWFSTDTNGNQFFGCWTQRYSNTNLVALLMVSISFSFGRGLALTFFIASWMCFRV